jgi:hypothetical protein
VSSSVFFVPFSKMRREKESKKKKKKKGRDPGSFILDVRVPVLSVVEGRLFIR